MTIALAASVGLILGFAASEFCRPKRRPVTIILTVPITAKEGIPIPNLEISLNTTEYVPIQTKDANGDVVAPPAGDTFSVASSDPSITASVGTMPSGSLAGQVCAVLAAGGTEATNVTITVTDQDGLTAATQVCDVVAGPPSSIFLDVADAVNVPSGQVQGQAKPLGTGGPVPPSGPNPGL
jgi:hypothetical protein